jgi:WS/DGAT/MGAT family acyltransferase
MQAVSEQPDDAELIPVAFEDRMSDSDAVMWTIEKDPMLRSTITTAVVLESPVDTEQLHRTFERASRIIPRLRQRVRSNPLSIAPPRWELDPNFDLRYHLRTARVPGSGSMGDLLAMAAPIAMQGFDRARPLWEATVVDGMSAGRSAIILKVHHAITDGVGGVRLMLELFDLAPDAPERAMPPEPVVHVMNQTERFVDAFQHERRRQAGMLRRTAASGVEGLVGVAYDPTGAVVNTTELLSSAARLLRPVATPLSPIMTRRSLSNHFDVLTMPLDLAKKVGNSFGGTLNDTFVGGIARGLHLYHRHHGHEPELLRMGMPISVRDAASANTAGNAFVPARLEVPIAFDEPGELLRAVRSHCVAARDEPANQLVEPMSNLLNRLPTSVVTQIFGTMMRGLDFQASNVPGSPIPLYLRGVPVEAVFPFGPLAGAAVNVTLLSYQNELNVGVNVDPAAVPDTDLFMECLRTAYDDLLDLV